MPFLCCELPFQALSCRQALCISSLYKSILLDTTDSSFQIVTQAGLDGGKWSAFVDLAYLKTPDNYNGRFFKVNSDSKQWFADASIA